MLGSYAVEIALIVVLLIIAVFLIRFVIKRVTARPRDYSTDYITALNYLLNGDKKHALEKFTETVRKDTGNIHAYLKIGDILKDQGDYLRAIKIHRGLLIRNNLKNSERIEILKSLFYDYRQAGKFSHAKKTSDELLKLTRNQTWLKEEQLDLYEKMEDWERAYELRGSIADHTNLDEQHKVMALYKVEAGLKLTNQGSEHDGRLKFRDAIRTDKQCAPAYLYLSDSYIRENRLTDALTQLKRFITTVPKLAYLAFDRLKEIMYLKGDFGELETIYYSLLRTNPELIEVRFALADLYERKGDVKKAIDSCKKVLEMLPDSTLAKQYLVNYYARTDAADNALKIALELIHSSLSEERKFVCNVCGFTSNKPFWHCPECKAWNSSVS